jgi:hypothetical protein
MPEGPGGLQGAADHSPPEAARRIRVNGKPLQPVRGAPGLAIVTLAAESAEGASQVAMQKAHCQGAIPSSVIQSIRLQVESPFRAIRNRPAESQRAIR